MADTFNEFAECDEGYGSSAPEPVLDAEGYPQVAFHFIPSLYYVNTVLATQIIDCHRRKQTILLRFARKRPRTISQVRFQLLFDDCDLYSEASILSF